MAALARLIALVLAVCGASAAWSIGTVAASAQAGTVYSFNTNGYGAWSPSISGTGYASGAEACAAMSLPTIPGANPSTRTVNGTTETIGAWQNKGYTSNQCHFRAYWPSDPTCSSSCGFVDYPISSGAGTLYTCPANSTKISGTSNCTCNLGTRTANPDGTGACVGYTCPSTVLPNDTNAGPYASKPELGADLYYCDTARNVYTGNATYGCSITAGPYYAGQGADGNWWVRYVNRFNVAPCMGDGNDVKPSQTPPIPAAPGTAASGVSADANGSTPPSSSPCAKGTCPGVFNGTSMCLACSSEVSTQNTTTTTPSGAASAPTGTQAGSTSTQVSCTGTTCTTTTTTYSSSGAVVGQTSTTGTKTAACTANPGSSLCSGSGSGGGTGDSSFGGTCGAFTCSGDAVQCAIALDQHKRNCTLFDTATTLSTAGEAAVAAGTTAQVGAGSSTTALGTFDQTDIVSGTCPSSVSIGGLVTMNLTPLCSAAGWLGNLLVGLTALACLGIVFGVKGGT